MVGVSTRWRAPWWPSVPDRSALVRAFRSVIHHRPSIAASATSSQLGVELLQQSRSDLTDGFVTKRWIDVGASVSLVTLAGCLLDVMYPQPRLHRNPEAGSGPGVTLFIDLRPEALQDRLSLGLVSGQLGKTQFPSGQRIDACLHQNLVGVPAPPDMSTLTTIGNRLFDHTKIVAGDILDDIDRQAKLP